MANVRLGVFRSQGIYIYATMSTKIVKFFIIYSINDKIAIDRAKLSGHTSHSDKQKRCKSNPSADERDTHLPSVHQDLELEQRQHVLSHDHRQFGAWQQTFMRNRIGKLNRAVLVDSNSFLSIHQLLKL